MLFVFHNSPFKKNPILEDGPFIVLFFSFFQWTAEREGSGQTNVN